MRPVPRQLGTGGALTPLAAFHHSLTLAFTACERERLQIRMSEGAITQEQFDDELKRSVRCVASPGARNHQV